MDVWDDLINDLWPDETDEESFAISYLRGRLNRDLLRKSTALRLAPNVWAECAGSLHLD